MSNTCASKILIETELIESLDNRSYISYISAGTKVFIKFGHLLFKRTSLMLLPIRHVLIKKKELILNTFSFLSFALNSSGIDSPLLAWFKCLTQTI